MRLENQKSPSRSSRYRLALVVSVVFHLLLIVLLSVWYWPEVKTSFSQAEKNTPPPAPAKSTPPAIAPTTNIEVPPEQIRSSIESQLEQVAAVPPEKKLKELDKNLKRLEQVSDTESVERVTQTIAESIGIDSNQFAEKPEPVDGEFDHKTAQIEDVIRTKNDDGDWQYEAVMVDADGHKLKTPLTETEGETVYDAFEKMKKYPIADGIYRQIVMPMLQKILETPKPK